MPPWTLVRASTLAIVAFTGATAQSTRPPASLDPSALWVHESWTVENGLPVNSINQLIQSRSGYIWAATFDGLVRFDGVRFTVFNSATSEGLPSNRIMWVREARDGTLWLFTEQHHLVHFRDGAFVHVNRDRGLGDEQIETVLEDSTGVVWVATTKGVGVIRDDRFVPIGRETISAYARSLVQRSDGSIWVGTERRGIFRITPNGQATRVAADSALDGDIVGRMDEDSDGTLWIAANRGFWRWRDRPTRVPLPGLDPAQPLLVLNVVRSPTAAALYVQAERRLYRVDSTSVAVVDSLGQFLMGTRLWTDGRAVWHAAGPAVFRDGRETFALAPPEPTTGAIIPPYTITTALVDREGSFWLGTHAAGLHRLKPALFTTYSTKEGVADQNVYPTLIDYSGVVWVGTAGKGLSRIDPSTGRVESFGPPRVRPRINTFYEPKPGAMWVGGQRFFANVCETATMTCRYAGPPGEELRTLFALHGDASGAIWAGSGGGLFRLDGARWTHLDSADGAPRAPVRAFVNTRDGAVWMGTNGGGVVRYHDRRFTAITAADGLPSNLIRSLYEDADGWLWVGTEGRGLARLDPRAWGSAGGTCTERSECDRRIVRVGTRDGLFDEVIHQILEDHAGRFWMSTNRGIFWVTRAELNAFADGKIKRVHSTGYTERDGMRNREANGGVYPAGAKGKDGRLWFPTQDGVVVVDPARAGGERLAPPILVEQVVANGQARPPNADSIALGIDERDVQIEYTALTFLEPRNVRFRYRLEPYDKDWVDAGNRRTAFYTKLPPGEYTFRVESSTAEGGWHEPGGTLTVHVLPQLWETRLFRWSLIATLGTLLVAGFRWRVARLHTRAAELERVVSERTIELSNRERQLAEQNVQLAALDQAKTRFFANVSHELRTPLTLTIGPLQDIRARVGADPQVQRWLDIAMRNSQRLLRLVNQILDVAKLEAGEMRLSPRRFDLVALIRGITSAFVAVAEQRSIALTLNVPDELPVVLDPDAFEKILTNLLSNAIKFTPAGGSIEIVLTHGAATLTLDVIDTGPGIPADQLAHVFERFYQTDESSSRAQPGTGIGLSLVKELVDVQQGRVTVASNEAGTTFSVTLPRGTADVADSPAAAASGGEVPAVAFVDTADHAPETIIDDDTTDADAERDVPTLLVVDDSADLRAYVRDHFASTFRVIEGGDGAEGIMLAQRHLPDIVISDVMMPGTDGHALLRALRSSPETDFVPVILLTAQAEGDQRLAGLEGGADDYIVKPFEMRELEARVRNIIESRRRLRARLTSGAPLNDAASPPTADSAPIEADRFSPADRAFMDKVTGIIERHLPDSDFDVTALSREAGVERSRLFRRTRDLFELAPSDLIRSMRIAAGARLLASRSGTVADVAYAVGFNSVAYFRRCFQEAYGVTPAAYRDEPGFSPARGAGKR
ncbi:MAG TPA: two-component regulator propeller domain-containing protein [Gemmatimonadaceae bacterium]|nr:two-component regulator propeller domain-containing protein [Gemmatimonadaceae bacterium]